MQKDPSFSNNRAGYGIRLIQAIYEDSPSLDAEFEFYFGKQI